MRGEWLAPVEPRDLPFFEAMLERIRTRGWSLTLGDDRFAELERLLDRLSTAPTPAAERDARDLLVALREHWEPETPDPEERYRVRAIAAPVFRTDGSIVLLLTRPRRVRPTVSPARDRPYPRAPSCARPTQ